MQALDEATLANYIEMLKNSMKPDNEAQTLSRQQYEFLSPQDDFSAYLAAIYGGEVAVDASLRQMAGLGLKSHIDSNFIKISPQTIEFCQTKILLGFRAQETSLSETASNLISTIVVRGGLNVWPGIVDFLIEHLGTEEVEHASHALSLIIEDSNDAFVHAKYRDNLVDLTAKSLELLSQSSSEKVKANLIHAMNMLVLTSNEIVYDQTEKYLEVLVNMIEESGSTLIQFKALQGVTSVLDFRPELIIKSYTKVFDLMLKALIPHDQRISLTAAEFWSGLLYAYLPEGDEQRLAALEEVLPHLVGPLLDCCIFTEEDQMLIDESKDQDIAIFNDKYYESHTVEFTDEGEDMEGTR